jgi:hypothetical protein
MWVFVVENKAFGHRAFCRQVEGQQQFGSYSAESIQGLINWRDTWAPALRAALRQVGSLNLKPILARALQMATSPQPPPCRVSLFANAMAVPLVKAIFRKNVDQTGISGRSSVAFPGPLDGR